MPKIQWSGLPEALRKHLLLRLKERQVTEQDLLKLMDWRQTEPDAPDGLWYKDFGSFKICGEGQYPKTFLLKGQPAKGEPPLTCSSLAGRTNHTQTGGADVSTVAFPCLFQ